MNGIVRVSSMLFWCSNAIILASDSKQKIVGIVLAILVFVWDVGGDYRKWQKGIEVSHKCEWVIRCLLLTPTFILMGGLSSIVMGVSVASLMGSWWLLWFDGVYNRLRKMDFWFAGDPIGKKDDSWWDQILRKLTRKGRAVLKIIALVVSTCIYIALEWGGLMSN